MPVQPDLYVLIDIPVEESFKRRPERRDRNESHRGYLERVRVAYLRLFTERHEANMARARGDGKTRNTYVPGPAWRVVDGIGTKEQDAERIWTAVGL
jgi:thymidylate kinase